MIFQEEDFLSAYQDAKPLLQEHHEEISKYVDLVLDVDEEKYQRLDELGLYKVFTIRKEDGGLVGYAGFFVNPMLHFKNYTQAHNDLIYVKKEYRGNGVGRSFMRFIDEVLQHFGVSVTFYAVPAKNNWGMLLKDMGYSLHDYMFSRRY